MRTLIRVAGRQGDPAAGVSRDVPAFWLEKPRGGALGGPVAVSSLLHLFMVFVLPPIVTWLPFDPEPPLNLTHIARSPEDVRLLLPSRNLTFDRQKPVLQARQGDAGRLRAGSGQGSGGGKEGRRSPGTPQRTLPPGRSVRGEGIILQPAPALKVRPEIPQLPSVAVWTGITPPAPAPIEPGVAKPVEKPSPVAAKPMVLPPIQDVKASMIPLPQLRQRTRGPVLPPAASVPVALAHDQPLVPPTVPGEQMQGKPAAVIAITPNPPKSREEVKIAQDLAAVGAGRRTNLSAADGPAGLETTESGTSTRPGSGPNGTGGTGTDARGQGFGVRGAGRGSGSGDVDGEGQGRGKGAGTGTGNAEGPGSGSSGKAGSGSGAGSATGPGSGNSGDGTGTGRDGRGSGGGGVLREWSIPAPAGAIRVVEYEDGSRRLQYPKSGTYDVVVLEASLPDDVPRPEQYLTGRPIYTVYLNTGWKRDWVLQYSEPKKAAGGLGGMVISLGRAEKLSAPFIQLAVVPPDGTLDADRYLLFQGRITSEGKFTDLKPAGRTYEDHVRLIPYLSRWTFRPPMKGEKPVDIEVVLVVPPKPTV